MSTADTMMPLVSAPWLDRAGEPLPVAPVPGLRPEVIHGMTPSYPGIISPELRELLGFCSGLSGTELGSIDFTGCLFPAEPLNVFRPCLTLGIDDEGRRWIAETSRGRGLPGPIWCVFPDPQVAVYVSDDLAAFTKTLRTSAQEGRTLAWQQSLLAQARVVWSHREALALRSREACSSDAAVRAWLSGLPFDAHVYDLRSSSPARGWPYGLAGPSARLYRCGRLPVFAVVGRPAGSRWAPCPTGQDPNDSLAESAAGERRRSARQAHTQLRRTPAIRAVQRSPACGSRARFLVNGRRFRSCA